MKRICLLLIILTMNGMPMNEARSSQQSSPEELRKQGNHLRDEPSLYLQQHAYNPIDWYPWGPEALKKAKDEDKPIFLSIGYSSCHWCHVMEHETFEKDDVAQFMNTHFICIKVDREERPDLDAVYMEAVQMMTGRGGWPMSVFLTPDLKPFYGGTYFPKETFMNLTDQIMTAYSAQRGSLEEQAEKLTTQIQRTSEAILGEGEGLTGQMIDQAVEKAQHSYDAQNGGFRQGQKFPTPVKWRFLLHEYRFAGDKELGRMISHSLEAMARGGLYDHVGGGFHRYTVDEDWTVPHFEKMLYDNGQMASLMLEAGAVFARPDFTATGLDVLDFLLREMKDDQGGIFASFDADSGGEEGSYYVWNKADITAVVGTEDGPALADVLGVTPEGNFEHTGKSVLTRRADLSELGKKHQSTESELTDLFAKHRLALREQRSQRTTPGLDRKIVTSWNGLALTALAQGYAVSGNETYLKAAHKTANFLLMEHRRQDGSLWRTSSDGRLSGEGILDDYAFLTDGLLELYQVSGDSKYLAAAKELVDFALNHFDNPEGTFYLSRAEVKAPLGRRVEYFDSVEPAGASAMMNSLIKLSAMTGETRYLDRARKDLDRVSSLLDRAGPEMAWWFDAARKLTAPYYDVVIAGDNGQGIAMLQALTSRLPASAVVSLIPASGAPAGLTKLAPALVGKTALPGQPTAFVCKFGTCNAPTTEVKEMLKQSLGGWKH